MKESDNILKKEEMLKEAILLLRSMEWTEVRIKRLLWQLEQAEKKFDEELQNSLRVSIQGMLSRIKKEDKNVESFLEKYKDILNEKEKSLFNFREKH
jgi:hypothetical protein